MDLRAVDARIGRAAEHAKALDDLVAAYVALPPWREERRPGSSPERQIRRVDLQVPLPITVPIVLSDAIHQSRAALDNLVTALRGGIASDRTYFPIRDNATAYDNVVGSYLQGVPDWAKDLIRDMQSFSGSLIRYLGDELEQLHDLARIDRHQAPPVQVAFLQPDYVTSNEGADVQFRSNLATWAEVEYVTGLVGVVHFKVEVRFDPSVPSVGDFEVVPWTSVIVRAVADVVARVRQEAAAQGI